LAAKCSQPFSPADPATGKKASAKCCTSDITLAEFKTLSAKMDAFNPDAATAADYQNGTPRWRTDLYANSGTLMTHDESIALIKSLGAKFTPELKAPEVPMPFDGDYTQEQYATQMLEAYKTAGVPPGDVFAQSFNLNDVLFWLKTEPAFGAQAVYLDGRYETQGFDHTKPETWKPSMTELKASGVKILAPPIYMMLALNDKGEIVPSAYAKAAKAAGLDLIGWSLERDGPLDKGGGFYHRSVKSAIDRDGDTLTVLDVLAKQVGIRGMFSDWPATTTFYASCMGMKAVARRGSERRNNGGLRYADPPYAIYLAFRSDSLEPLIPDLTSIHLSLDLNANTSPLYRPAQLGRGRIDEKHTNDRNIVNLMFDFILNYLTTANCRASSLAFPPSCRAASPARVRYAAASSAA
jgi:glycerophosphoryl diester phosphodiesterase